VRAGSQQASNAAIGMNDTATGYESEDAAAAGNYDQFGGVSTAGAAPLATVSGPTSASAVRASMPTFDPIPDISGTDGETLARQLETGAGPGPATTAATRLAALAARAQAANVSRVNAHTQLLATGESQATPGMAAKLIRGIAWTEAVAGHASALAGGYEAAGNLHTLTYSQVGPSAEWVTLKTGYNESLIENAMTGGLSQPKVYAFKQALDDKDQLKGVAANGLQAGGEGVSTPPGELPAPGMDPNSDAPGDKDKKGDNDKKKSDAEDPSGMGDMLQPLMGALGPLTQSLGKANPLQSVGQMAQQLGQQAGKLGADAAKKAASPLNPAALVKPLANAGKGGAGGGKGGGSPIKPASNLTGAVHPASLTGTPQATPPTAATPIKAAAAGAAAGGGMGLMPMGHKPGNDSKTSKINSYEQPLPEVEGAGRPGVVGEVSKPVSPVVNPDSQNAVAARLARRKKDETADGNE
jgi:hypothetical protein